MSYSVNGLQRRVERLERVEALYADCATCLMRWLDALQGPNPQPPEGPCPACGDTRCPLQQLRELFLQDHRAGDALPPVLDDLDEDDEPPAQWLA